MQLMAAEAPGKHGMTGWQSPARRTPDEEEQTANGKQQQHATITQLYPVPSAISLEQRL
jgi:hypothetical protein